jgi:hypothetical protein
MTVVELRQYTLAAGRRDELIDLFEAEFMEPQEACGIRILGTFRDLGDAQRFVWIRSFPDMVARAKSLADFYGGSAWRRHREVANATMIDSDNVLLLRPAWEPSGLETEAREKPGDDDPGVVLVGIASFSEPIAGPQLAYFHEEVAPRVQASGTLFAGLVTEPATNTFPALPVREGENVFVWCAGFSGHRREMATQVELARITSAWPGSDGAAEILTLAPTGRSPLRGDSVNHLPLEASVRQTA